MLAQMKKRIQNELRPSYVLGLLLVSWDSVGPVSLSVCTVYSLSVSSLCPCALRLCCLSVFQSQSFSL